MADILLILNNTSSVVLMVVCWWLVHEYSVAGNPLGRTIAVLIGLFGLSVGVTAFMRNIHWDANPPFVAMKLALILLFIIVARRLSIKRRTGELRGH